MIKYFINGKENFTFYFKPKAEYMTLTLIKNSYKTQ